MIPEWTNKLREWRSFYEEFLDPHYRKIAKQVAIIHSLNKDSVRDAGLYIYNPKGFHEIRMSVHQAEDEAKRTYGHEFAHFLAVLFYKEHVHGFFWKSFMTAFDLPANEFHDMPLGARCVVAGLLEKLDGHARPE